MQTKESITEPPTGKLIQIDESRVRDHLAEIVLGSVEETLNALLQKEADELCQARRYERKEARVCTRAGTYELVRSGAIETLSYYAFPNEHRRRLTNVRELSVIRFAHSLRYPPRRSPLSTAPLWAA